MGIYFRERKITVWAPRAILSLIILSCFLPLAAAALPAGSFGAGTFGNCEFGACSITISATQSCSGVVCLNVTPTSSGACTINDDSVNVQTQYSGGYTLSIINANSAVALTNGSNTIPATSGSYASPVALSVNTWGYRLDSVGSFGAGPTTATSNASVSSISGLSFAATPVSTGSPDTIASTSGPSSMSGDSYTFWYGVCVNNSVSYGNYSSGVTYTATTN